MRYSASMSYTDKAVMGRQLHAHWGWRFCNTSTITHHGAFRRHDSTRWMLTPRKQIWLILILIRDSHWYLQLSYRLNVASLKRHTVDIRRPVNVIMRVQRSWHQIRTGTPSQYQDHFSRYGDSLYKDKTTVRYNENSYPGKTTFLYWDGTQAIGNRHDERNVILITC